MTLQLPLVYDPLPEAFGEKRRRRLTPHFDEMKQALLSYPLSPSENNIIESAFQPNSPIKSIDMLYSLFLKKITNPEHAELRNRILSSVMVGTFRSGWAILPVPYYVISPIRDQIGQETGVKPSVPAWGSHITVIQGDRQTPSAVLERPNRWRYKDKEIFEVEVDTTIRKTGHSYYFLCVKSPQLEELRKDLSLSPTPLKGFHITIGRIQ